MNKFSIIIPVYNVEEYLPRCIGSVLSQTFTNYEVILVNDGSTDKSSEICDRYAQKDIRIKVIHKKNGGVSSARNAGLKIATGDYIWFVDSDDYIAKDSLKIFNMNLCDIPIDLFIINTSMNEIFNMDLEKFFDKYYFNYTVGFSLWNKLYKRSIIEENNISFDQEEKIGEDLLFNINYYIHTKYVKFIGETLYYYNIREGSAMTTKSKDRCIYQMRLYYKITDLLNNKISDEALCLFYVIHLLSGINQSIHGGITIKELVGFLKNNIKEISKYKKTFYRTLDTFLKNENASVVGKLRIRLFFLLYNKKMFSVASTFILKTRKKLKNRFL